MTPPTTPLSSLLAYYEPLSHLRRDLRGVPTLLTPGSPLLGANAAYLLPGTDEALVPLLRAWQLAQDTPPVLASAGPLPQLEPVEQEALRVGVYRAGGTPSPIGVEQVSRLYLSTFAAVLAEAQDLAGWAAPLARSLAAPLERLGADATLLMAYAGGEAVGALLLLGRGESGAAAHLWGTLDEAADAPLLDEAARLAGGELWTSLPDQSPVSVEGGGEVWFSLLP